MGHRRARKEVNQPMGARTRISASSFGAAMVLLIGACGGAEAPVAGAPAPGTNTGTTGVAGSPATPGTNTGVTPGTNTGVTPPVATPGTNTGVTPPVNNTPGTDPGQTAPGEGAGILPCNVNKIMAKNCTSCHGTQLIGGAPMPLVTYADFQKMGVLTPTKKVHELVKERIHDMARPMPPVNVAPMAAEDIAAMDAWFTGGALAGSSEDAACMTGGTTGEGTTNPGNHDGGIGRIVPRENETCYDFKVHGAQTANDESKFAIRPGELYEQFYYKVPWPAGQVASGYATIADNAQVLHHWLLFSTNEPQPEGAHIEAPLPTLIGTDPILLAGWAVGGPNLIMPDDVGMELPDPGRTMNVQWHFYNSTSGQQEDASLVQICTVPKESRPNVGGITWMGTEDLNGNVWAGGPGMGPGEQKFTTSCRPGRGDIPIHIMGFEPHMHRIGKNMQTSVITGGQKMSIFDKPFVFGSETHYFEEYDLKPGDTLETTCTFFNDTPNGVPFGESTDTEMCYQFTFHYPAHALTNGAFSLLGVTDTCW
jgi:hypothetical protein